MNKTVSNLSVGSAGLGAVLVSPAGLRRFAACLVVACVTCFSSAALGHDEVPGAAQKGPIAFVGGTIHTVSGGVIEGGVLLVEEGKITGVGKRVSLPDGTQEIDISGKHVYPGLFEAHSQVGLTEIGSVRATNDFSETGSINPNVQAQVAVNPDSEIIPVTRANGVLLALSAPSGGLVSGQSAVLQLDGWTFEDLTLKSSVGLHVNWPRQSPVLTLPGASDSPQGRRFGRGGGENDGLERLTDLFDEARRYQAVRAEKGEAHPTDLRLEAMQSVLAGETPMIVAADGIAEIQSAVGFAAEQKVRLILLGGYDAPLCAELLKSHDVPVIVSAVHRNPRRRHDPYDAAYTLPERLREAGIKFCISGSDRSESWNVRNLAYHAATAVAYGLPADEGLRSVTLSPAEILGVADRVGSLETGKDATLIVTDGDPLETATQIERAFVQGREVMLSSRHTRLYEKYKTRLERKK